MEHADLFIAGAGAAGIAAAKAAYAAGCRSILIADRQSDFGGVLVQCLHRGFGTDLTGPEYTKTLLSEFPQEIRFCRNATVLSVSPDRTAVLSGAEFGLKQISFRRMILAAGCREIPLGALPVTGTRPTGIYTAGQMQELVNLCGYTPEGPAVILGSGDLGLIMAVHLAERGVPVTLVEQKDSCGGLARNRRALERYRIPVLCGATLTEVFGAPHLEAVAVQTKETLQIIPCRTLLTAVGLRPEQELVAALGSPDWLWLCGNCAAVHPMVEGVVQDGAAAGLAAARSTRGAL